MSSDYTLGTYVLVVLILFIAINYVVAITSTFFGLMSSEIQQIDTITGGNYGWFTDTVTFLKQLFAWFVYIFSSDIQLVVLIALSLLYEAMESRWF